MAEILLLCPDVCHYGDFYFIAGEVVIILGGLHAARDSEAELRRRRELYS